MMEGTNTRSLQNLFIFFAITEHEYDKVDDVVSEIKSILLSNSNELDVG